MTGDKTTQPMVPIGTLADRLRSFVDKGRAAQDAVNAAIQVATHGPGPTFGELAIGEVFTWPAPIPPGGPITKVSETRYEWSGGYGTAEAFYRVERFNTEEARDGE